MRAYLFTTLALLLLATPAASQKRCVKGIPCGGTCISASKTCHVGSGSATARRPTSPARPTLTATIATPAAKDCRIQRIVDGDTLHCADSRTIRLLLIDTPEMDQAPYGGEAKRALSLLLPPGSIARVEMDVDDTDRYGRTLSYLFSPDGRMVNEEMARQGFALSLTYPPNVRYVDRIRAAVEEAKANRRGLWSGSAFECSPKDHRANRC